LQDILYFQVSPNYHCSNLAETSQRLYAT